MQAVRRQRLQVVRVQLEMIGVFPLDPVVGLGFEFLDGTDDFYRNAGVVEKGDVFEPVAEFAQTLGDLSLVVSDAGDQAQTRDDDLMRHRLSRGRGNIGVAFFETLFKKHGNFTHSGDFGDGIIRNRDIEQLFDLKHQFSHAQGVAADGLQVDIGSHHLHVEWMSRGQIKPEHAAQQSLERADVSGFTKFVKRLFRSFRKPFEQFLRPVSFFVSDRGAQRSSLSFFGSVIDICLIMSFSGRGLDIRPGPATKFCWIILYFRKISRGNL